MTDDKIAILEAVELSEDVYGKRRSTMLKRIQQEIADYPEKRKKMGHKFMSKIDVVLEPVKDECSSSSSYHSDGEDSFEAKMAQE